MVTVAIALALVVGQDLATTRVTVINFTSRDNTCGIDGWSAPGFDTTGGRAIAQRIAVIDTNFFYSCRINNVSATTPGFGISDAKTPLDIPAGAESNLTVTIDPPSGSFAGALTIDVE
ncbi:MAG: hypothetical protein ACRECT_03760 [Thermoplasmata archaeon]